MCVMQVKIICTIHYLEERICPLYTVICYIEVPFRVNSIVFKDIQMYRCVHCENNLMNQWL